MKIEINWKQWAQEFLALLEEEEPAEQEGKPGDKAGQSAKRKELEVKLPTEPGHLALQNVNWKGPLEAAANAADSDAALEVLRNHSSIAVMPLKCRHGREQPEPVLWQDAGGQRADAVLSGGEVAVLSGPGGIGKSWLALAWALAGTKKEGVIN